MKLDNRTIMVIGGTSGIGMRVAEKAAKAGARLVVTGRDAKRLATAVEALKSIGPDVAGHVVDASDAKNLEDFFAGIEPFDHLVSMAGGAMGGGFLQAPFETIRKAVEEKLFANLAIARLAAPHLRDGGSMVFTSGSGGRPHNASGAIIGNDSIQTLVKGLAVELAPRARANSVAPTWTDTPLWRDMPREQVEEIKQRFAQSIPLGRTADIDEVASAYIFLMENSFVTGQTIFVDGGLTLVQ